MICAQNKNVNGVTDERRTMGGLNTSPYEQGELTIN